VESSGRAADLDGGESWSADFGGRRENVAEEESDGAEEVVPEDADGEYVDGDGGGVAGEEVGGYSEDEFVIPGRVLCTGAVDLGFELGIRVDPDVGISFQTAERDGGGGGFEALGGDQGDLQ